MPKLYLFNKNTLILCTTHTFISEITHEIEMLDVKYTVKSVYWDVRKYIVLWFPLCCHSFPAYGVCVCVSVGESVYAYVSSHAYVRAHKHQNESISVERERDSEEAVRVCSHIWAFLRDFPFPSPDCAGSDCLWKACLKSLIILYKPKDQGSVLRVSSGAHHFVWGDFRALVLSPPSWAQTRFIRSASPAIMSSTSKWACVSFPSNPRYTVQITRINDLRTTESLYLMLSVMLDQISQNSDILAQALHTTWHFVPWSDGISTSGLCCPVNKI